jgi:hypothetical protein
VFQTAFHTGGYLLGARLRKRSDSQTAVILGARSLTMREHSDSCSVPTGSRYIRNLHRSPLFRRVPDVTSKPKYSTLRLRALIRRFCADFSLSDERVKDARLYAIGGSASAFIFGVIDYFNLHDKSEKFDVIAENLITIAAENFIPYTASLFINVMLVLAFLVALLSRSWKKRIREQTIHGMSIAIAAGSAMFSLLSSFFVMAVLFEGLSPPPCFNPEYYENCNIDTFIKIIAFTLLVFVTILFAAFFLYFALHADTKKAKLWEVVVLVCALVVVNSIGT